MENGDERAFDEYDLETVIPKIGENVKIIDGDKIGKIGQIKDKIKGTNLLSSLF